MHFISMHHQRSALQRARGHLGTEQRSLWGTGAGTGAKEELGPPKRNLLQQNLGTFSGPSEISPSSLGPCLLCAPEIPDTELSWSCFKRCLILATKEGSTSTS